MSEYRATITYDRPRRFVEDKVSGVIPSGELIRLRNATVVAYIKPCVPLDVQVGVPFEGMILFLSKEEESKPLNTGETFEIVMPKYGDFEAIGRCTIVAPVNK